MLAAMDGMPVVVNWLVASQYIAGVIILAAAPCTAMVFVWCNIRQAKYVTARTTADSPVTRPWKNCLKLSQTARGFAC